MAGDLAAPLTVENALSHLKKIVFTQRIRIGDFLKPFDTLRSGFIVPNHFLSAMSMARLDKEMTPAELQLICDAYTVPRTQSLIQVDYKSFLDEVEAIFVVPTLERYPLADVPPEPSELLDRTRYYKPSRVLSEEAEAEYSRIVEKLKSIIKKRGTPVKPFFDDASRDAGSTKVVGHVSRSQFRQVMGTMDLILTEAEAKVLIDKYRHPGKEEYVNYVAFANTIDPTVPV